MKNAGFYIDEPVARKIAAAVKNPGWFTGSNSVVDFILQTKIRANPKYAGKSPEEHKRLLVSALISWTNIPDEYPAWLEKQHKADRNRERERLRSEIPKNCPRCGTALNDFRRCTGCRGFVSFDEAALRWVYSEPFDSSAIKTLPPAGAEGGGNAPAGEENTEF